MDTGKIYQGVNNTLLWIEHNWKLLFIGAMAIGLFFSIKSCNENKEIKDNHTAELIWKAAKYDSFLNASGKKVLESQVAVTTDQGLIKDESAKNLDLKPKDEKKIKKVVATGEIDQQINVKNKFVPIDTGRIDSGIDDGEACNGDTLDIWPNYYQGKRQVVGEWYIISKDSAFLIGDSFTAIDTGSYSFKATLAVVNGKRGLNIDNFHATDSIYWRVAEKKTGWFKNRETIAQVSNTNKLFELTGTKTMILKQKPNVWNKVIKPVLAFIAGSLITYKLVR